MLTNLARFYFLLPDHMLDIGEPVETGTICSMPLKCLSHKVTRCQSCSHDMVQNTILKGDTLNTAHGLGVVIGFERFSGMERADIQSGKERIILELHDGHNWPCLGNYAFYFKDIKVFN